jgi:hypothetical protein
MLELTKVRELILSSAPTVGRASHLSAASGLVCLHSFIYVITDDELHLAIFSNDHHEPGHLVRLFEGELPHSKRDRKKQKPDFEALILLPAFDRYAHGALLVMGSGSRKNRCFGALVALDASGGVRGAPHVIDLAPMLAPLEDEFRALNIEGAVVSGIELRLLQRGNKRHSENAMIRFQLSDLLTILTSRRSGAIKPISIDRFDLGEVAGVPLCFTDGAALADGGMVFTAVAENTDDSYHDGPCVGAAVGVLDGGGSVRSLFRLDEPHKVEGVHARLENDVIHLLLVTDADNADIPASLFSATIER